jgi:hypothetical protein
MCELLYRVTGTDVELDAYEFSLLVVIADKANDAYCCWRKIEQIARKHMSLRTAKTKLEGLVKRGLLRKYERFWSDTGKQTSNVYMPIGWMTELEIAQAEHWLFRTQRGNLNGARVRGGATDAPPGGATDARLDTPNTDTPNEKISDSLRSSLSDQGGFDDVEEDMVEPEIVDGEIVEESTELVLMDVPQTVEVRQSARAAWIAKVEKDADLVLRPRHTFDLETESGVKRAAKALADLWCSIRRDTSKKEFMSARIVCEKAIRTGFWPIPEIARALWSVNASGFGIADRTLRFALDAPKRSAAESKSRQQVEVEGRWARQMERARQKEREMGLQ